MQQPVASRNLPWIFVGMSAWVGMCLFAGFAILADADLVWRLLAGGAALALAGAYTVWVRPFYAARKRR
ncbi:hypothetical protein GCM10009547_10930 [Sporichthya brevicatena]|uniref:DUF2530 domain-containing protein n=1 Tax=Sporichthya brevicatena TaxID=171442 RepID=A0ABP3RI43_9ACTN